MTNEVKEDIDIDSMDFDELSKHLDDVEGVKTEMDTESQSEPEETDGANEDTKEEVQEETEESKEDETSNESPFTKGKSRDELLEIISNNNKNASRQENEIHNFRKSQDEMRTELNEIKKINTDNKTKEKEDDIYKDYDKDDLNIIDTRVVKILEQRNENERINNQKQQERYSDENEQVWKSIADTMSITDPDLKVNLEKKLLDEIKSKGKESTLSSKGWVSAYSRRILPELSKSKESLKPSTSKEGLIKRKKDASTTTGGANTSSNNSLKGKPEPSDPDEYVKWLIANTGERI